MSALFDNILKSEESLFINEDALDFEYLPKFLPYRENQQQYLASVIKPLFHGRAGKNLLIIGKTGIGKTAATRWVLREMEEKGLDEEVKPLYINCWKKNTPHQVILEICDQINYKFVQNKRTDELVKIAASILNKKAAVIILDEVDKLETQEAIYLLLEELHRKCLFLITNEKAWLTKLDQRIKSRLIPEIVEFKPYTLEETRGILKERVKYAFVRGVFEEKAFNTIAEKTFEEEDVRLGLFLLKEAGINAEEEGSKKIIEKHANFAISKIDNYCLAIKTSPEALTDEDKAVLELIKEHNEKPAKTIYEIYNKIHGKSYRTFHRRVKNLESAGLIEVYEETKGVIKNPILRAVQK